MTVIDDHLATTPETTIPNFDEDVLLSKSSIGFAEAAELVASLQQASMPLTPYEEQLYFRVAYSWQGPPNPATSIPEPVDLTEFQPETPGVAITPERLSFGEVSVETLSELRTVHISSSGGVPSSTVTGADAASFQIQDCPGTALPPAVECLIAVQFQPQRLGPHRAELLIEHNVSRSRQVVSLDGLGVAPGLVPEPASLDFGEVQTGAESRRQVTLTNAGSAPFVISRLGFTGELEEFDVDPSTCATSVLAPNEGCRVELNFRPTSAGSHDLQLVIDYGADKTLEVPIAARAVARAEPTGDVTDLQYQDRGDRLEGLRAKPVSGYDIALLSATVDYREPSDGWPEKLRIGFYLPEGDEVFVTARLLRPRANYWLDKVRPTSPWCPGEFNEFILETTILAQLSSVGVADLGVVVRRHESPRQSEIVAPAIVYHSRMPPEVAGYRFTFRTNATARIECTLFRDQTEVYVRPLKLERAGSPFAVRWVSSDPSDGWYRLVLSGYFESDNAPLGKEVRFFHRSELTP